MAASNDMLDNVATDVKESNGDKESEDNYLVSDVKEHNQEKNEDINPDIGTRHEDSNIFKGLCDGVLSAMTLVHEAIQDLLDFKDEMLEHSLPPIVLSHLALITGRVFRSISDLGVPVSELVRLVRLYSSSWKEQSSALNSLYQSFSSKDKQLNIAIRRLQLIDEKSKQMARERCLMNWQKLFINVTSTKSHGRQWKFHIETIKQNAKLGLEHIQAYTKCFDEFSKSGEEDDVDDKEEVGHVYDLKESCERELDDPVKDLHSVTNDESKKDIIDQNVALTAQGERPVDVKSVQVPTIRSVQVPTVQSKMHAPAERAVTFKPPKQDAQTWTQEAEFDRFLFIRIFCPEGFKKSKLKCSLSYNGKMLKTPVLDNNLEEVSNDNLLDTSDGRTNADKPQAAQNTAGRSSKAVGSDLEHSSSLQKRFCEFHIPLPDEVKNGVLVREKQVMSEPEILRFAVHHGKFEEIIGLANLDFTDIKNMNLETVYLPPPHGDDDVPVTSSRSHSFSSNDDSLSDFRDMMVIDENQPDHVITATKYDLIKNHEPQLLPLFSLSSTISDQVQKASGHLPVLIYWGLRSRPLYFHRQSGTGGSLNMAEFDLLSLDGENTQKETKDEALSVISITPQVQEEMVLKTDYDIMVEQHEQEVNRIHEKYGKKIEEMTSNIEVLQANLLAVFQQSRPASKTSVHSGSARVSPVTRRPQSSFEKDKSWRAFDLSDTAIRRQKPVPPKTQKPTKNFRVGHRLPRWGEHLPQDFMERLSQWAEESKQHKQELSKKTLKDIKESIERKLAGEFKLSKCEKQEVFDALQDVSLPAMFMPFKTGSVYNPRAYQYFQPTGAAGVRISQPPSVFQLPPLTDSRFSVANLFELSKNFHIHGPTWLVEEYINSLAQLKETIESTPPHNLESPPATTSDKP